jgi:hypothetical protein
MWNMQLKRINKNTAEFNSKTHLALICKLIQASKVTLESRQTQIILPELITFLMLQERLFCQSEA